MEIGPLSHTAFMPSVWLWMTMRSSDRPGNDATTVRVGAAADDAERRRVPATEPAGPAEEDKRDRNGAASSTPRYSAGTSHCTPGYGAYWPSTCDRGRSWRNTS